MVSSFTLLVTYRELRRRAWLGGVNFAAFSALWTTLAFSCRGRRSTTRAAVIGLFALLGIAGVFAANSAGHQADKNRSSRSTIVASILVTGSFVVLLVGHATVWILGLGIVLLVH